MDSLAASSIIQIRSHHWELMRQDILLRLPEEACGLVAGQDGKSLEVFPISNILRSPVRFLMEPREQLHHLLMFESRGWVLLAIYHSHPQGPSFPSQTDIAEAAYPEAINLIWSPTSGYWDCRGFLIKDQRYKEAEIRRIPSK